jgi:ribosomal protein S18 acetylase RimI-like enzyme
MKGEYTLDSSVICRFGLSQQDLGSIKQLEKTVNEHDHIHMKLNWDFLKSRPEDEMNDFLFYHEGNLLGYLGIYIFNQKEAEVSAMVHPAFRNKRVFSKLMHAAKEEVKKRGINELLFFTDHQSTSAVKVLKELDATYDFSEYLMQWLKPIEDTLNQRLSIRSFASNDKGVSIELDHICFNISKNEAKKLFKDQENNKNKLQFMAELDGKVIGKISVLLDNEPAYLFGFAIFPTFQGKGYGRELLSYAIKYLVESSRNDIVLEVAVKNKHALELYEKVGFRQVTGYDYYRYPIK